MEFSFPKKLLQKIKNYFIKEKEKTIKRLSEIEKEDPFSDPDRLIDNAASDTEAKEESGHDRAMAIKRQLLLKLEKIEKVLRRIKKGKYGFCKKCGAMIDTDRLSIDPTAMLCVKCKKKMENE